MRTTIDIKESLVREAQALTKIRTKRRLVERSLEELMRQKRLERLTQRLGKWRLQLNLKDLARLRRDG